MSSFSRPSRLWVLVALQRTRGLLTALPYRLLVGLIAVGYGLGTMLFSGMLYVPSHPLRIGAFLYILPSGPGPSWTYPAILAGGPYFQVDLPILSTILMTLSAAGVGLGMALAVFLGVRLIRHRKAGLLKPTALGSAAGLTPAMIALVTLGACCSTTAAATAGISLATHASLISSAGTWTDTADLGVFQVAVIYLALLAQEHLVGIYGLFIEEPTPRLPSPEVAPTQAHVTSNPAKNRDPSN